MSNTAQSLASTRIASLLDENSFVEIGGQVTARSTDFKMAGMETPSDGVITGYGVINGSLVYVYSQDASVMGGTIGEMHAKKIARLYEFAQKTGAPVIGLVDCAGMRLQEATDALNGFGEIYMAQAMAGAGRHKQDEKLIGAAKKIWENIVQKRMYITGGIGSTVRGEAFTYDYDLPNDLMYCETCAAIGLLNFSNELLKTETDSQYADIMERTLYNSIISGMALDGKHFFYVNPLEVDPQASAENPDKSHVKATRPSWFGCACCPPNSARTLPAVGRYAFTQKEDEVLLNLFIDSELAGEQAG